MRLVLTVTASLKQPDDVFRHFMAAYIFLVFFSGKQGRLSGRGQGGMCALFSPFFSRCLDLHEDHATGYIQIRRRWYHLRGQLYQIT